MKSSTYTSRGGFEPPEPVRFGTLAVCWYKPLTHTSFISDAKVDRVSEVFFR